MNFWKWIKGLILFAVLAATVIVVAVSSFTDSLKIALQNSNIGFLQTAGAVLRPILPETSPVSKAYWLDQNWTNADRQWFHHAPQGTSTLPVPYEWFVALEQPEVNYLLPAQLLKEPGYLARLGFIPSPKSLETDAETRARFGFPAGAGSGLTVNTQIARTSADNLDGLPVGFARTPGYPDPVTGKPVADQLGFTCAACHTGHLNYKGTSLRFDGGPSLANFNSLEKIVGLSVIYTDKLPGRFNRFAQRVLGGNPAAEDMAKLKADFAKVIATLGRKLGNGKILADRNEKNVDEGIGRLDALTRIGNQVFFDNLHDADGKNHGADSNLAAISAPVSFPPIWTTPWLLWAQYDASILQPMVRNAGEAMGVAARVNMVSDKPGEQFRSSIVLNNLYWFEQMLKGTDPFEGPEPRSFKGLSSPAWPSKYFPDDKVWSLDPKRVESGRKLYQICMECHLGPINDPKFDADNAGSKLLFWTTDQWIQDFKGTGKVLHEIEKSVKGMGTDPSQADVLQKRFVTIPDALKIDPAKNLKDKWNCPDIPVRADGKIPFATALMVAVDRVIDQWFEVNPELKVFRTEMIGPRPNCTNPSVHAPIYRARPLNGIWATAPYLHNGSVPSLWWMLTPAAERPKKFCLGAQDFDPEQVGFRAEQTLPICKKGEFEFDTSLPGNHNTGHSFEGDGKQLPNGTLGRAFTPEERLDLIEYLKTL